MKIKNKKSQIEHIGLIAIISFIVLASGTILADNSTINSTIIPASLNIIEKIAEIEVWADTNIRLSALGEIVKARLSLDNETVLPGQEIEFYLNNTLLNSGATDSEGYAQTSFTPYNISPGIYLFKAEFQGNPSFYLNPSSTESQIEIINSNGTREVRMIEKTFLQEGNQTQINQTLMNESLMNESLSMISIKTNKINYFQNETIIISGEILINGEKINTKVILEIIFNETKIFESNIDATAGNYEYSLTANFTKEGEYLMRVSAENLSAETSFYFAFNSSFLDLGNMICKEFEDNLLWTSGFTPSSKGSEKYQIWNIGTSCEQAGGQNCFLQDISVGSRTIYISLDDKEINGKSYIQISNPDSSICDAPENGIYLKYLAYESIKGFEGQRKGLYCGEEKEESEELIKSKPKCGIKLNNKFTSDIECYGIKAHASQSAIIDVFKVNYKWCWDSSYGDTTQNSKKDNEGGNE